MAFHASKCCRIVLCNHYVVKALSTQHMKLFAPSSTANMLRFYSSDTQEENELQLVTLAHSIAAVTVTTQGVAVPGGRRRRLNQDVPPFSAFLTGDFCRRQTYLRVSMMEECNLRCTTAKRPLSLPKTRIFQGSSPPLSYVPHPRVLTSAMTLQQYHSISGGGQPSKDVSCLSGYTVSTVQPGVTCSGTHQCGRIPQWSHIVKRSRYGGDSASRVDPRSKYGNGDLLATPSYQTKASGSDTHTNVLSHNDTDCLKYTVTRGPNLIKNSSTRTSGIPSLCTLLRNAKTGPLLGQYSIRLCHRQTSRDVPQAKLKQPTQEHLVADANSSHYLKQDNPTTAQLTHTDAQGRASMVDVGSKSPTRRSATATATVHLGPTTFGLLRDNQLAKGDALAVAQLAGIMAAKQTSALIPLCHPLPLDHISVTFNLDASRLAAVVTATAHTTGRTGVEMEALTAVTVAALTLYDMCKAVSHDITVTDVKLVSKTGGKRDFHREP
nr:uncharacterized protein LOC115138266 [Oncorhynchus nerka]